MDFPKPIDLTVLVYGNFCSSARAYLVYLDARGLRPRKVLHVEAPGSRWQARLMSRTLGRRWAARLVERLIMRPFRTKTMRQLCDEVQSGFEVQVDYFGALDYRKFAEQYEHVIASDLNAPAVLDAVRRQPCKTLLYTAGGRVGSELLGLPGVRMLHIHPGIVPEIRGSDGLFWSLATAGRPGASCFYMNPGIDTGPVILTRTFDPIRLAPALRDVAPHDLATALLFACDPHLRAQLLLEVLERAGPEADLADLPTMPQAAHAGRTWYYMHSDLKARVVRHIQAASGDPS